MLLDNDLKIDVASSVSSVIMKKILETNSALELRNYLRSLQLEDLMPDIDNFIPNGDVYILGDLKIKEHIVFQIFKDLNIDTNRIKIVKGYTELKNYNFKRFQHDTSTRLIFVGPLPHSTKGKEDYSSIITMMEQEEGFPKIVRLGNDGILKISKTNLKNAIIEEIDSGYLDIN